MRLESLLGRSIREQKRLITNEKAIYLRNALKHPKKFKGKIIVFIGNYTGFFTRNFMVRTFEYVEQKRAWQIADIDLTDWSRRTKPKYFDKKAMKTNYKIFCNSKGFILKK